MKYIVVLLACQLFACMSTFGTDATSDVVRQASFDHECHAERIRIDASLLIGMRRSYRLDVCGRTRTYQDIGVNVSVFVDTTDRHR